MIVENRPGAGGTIGAYFVARAHPDGYTLLIGGAATHSFAKSLYPNLQYDPIESFSPITQVTSAPLVLVVKSDFAATNFKGFLDYLRANGKSVNYASNGVGTFPHLAVELLKQAASVNPTHIPYKGGPEAMLALLRGDVTFSINHIPNVLPMVTAGKLRGLATTGINRSTSFPDLPTFEESSIAGFEANAWFGLFAPRGTPDSIVQKIVTETAKALGTPRVREQLKIQGAEPVGSSSAAFAAYVQKEHDKWPKILKEAGLVSP